jgi:WbqC-like protein family
LRAAIHQPQYFPYPGFFHKLAMSDVYVIMDDAQYDKRYTNRNRIITPDGPIWITVPINKKQKFSPNNEVEINNELPWEALHWKQIQLSYNNSKFFPMYRGYFQEIYSRKWEKLFDLNFETLRQVISWLEIKVEIVQESSLGIKKSSTERLVEVCKVVGATEYVAGSGSKNYMDESLFERNNIKVVYQNYEPIVYEQRLSKNFEPNLSVIDLLANVGPDSAKLIR